MFHFHAFWFILLFPLPFVVRWLFPKAPANEALEIHFPHLDRLKRAFPVWQRKEKGIDFKFMGLLFSSWAGMILALMQPERVDQFLQVNQKGYDLVLAVDISGSMQALDFSTSDKRITRLDMTKEVVSTFIQGRKGDRLGLILFGQNAYLQVPLTLDSTSVCSMLKEAVAGMAGQATAIGDAIGLGVRTLRERPTDSRVLILLTDGEDNASSLPPLEAAKLAKQYGIRIYTIGIGKKGAVPMQNAIGGYSMVQVSIDEKLLKEISELTGGHYFSATSEKMLHAIYAKIDELEKSEANETLFLIREPLYPYPLSFCLLSLLALTVFQLLPKRVFYES